jgi:hypothetical protein
MDWFKGKSTGNRRFSHEIWDFPATFPLNQSIAYFDQQALMTKSLLCCLFFLRSYDRDVDGSMEASASVPTWISTIIAHLWGTGNSWLSWRHQQRANGKPGSAASQS